MLGSVLPSFVRWLIIALYLFHRVFFNPSFATVGKLNTEPTFNGAVGNVYALIADGLRDALDPNSKSGGNA